PPQGDLFRTADNLDLYSRFTTGNIQPDRLLQSVPAGASLSLNPGFAESLRSSNPDPSLTITVHMAFIEWAVMAATEEQRGELHSTISGVEVEPLYTEADVDLDYERDLGYPGAFPFTRGVYET